jgi:hypothetical protein
MKTSSPRRPAHAVLLAALLAVLAAVAPVVAAVPAAAGATPGLPAGPAGVTWGATIDGVDVATANSSNPLALPAGRDVRVDLAVDNQGTAPFTVRAVRLEGRVLGMSFYSFTTQVDLVVEPGTKQDRSIALDLGELGAQAIGLIPARLSLLAPDRSVVTSQPLSTDVRGSLISAYGLFGLAVGGITLVLIVGLALEIARHRLPANRWRRAVRFLAPGFGMGLAATFTLSVTRLLIPSASLWLTLVLAFGAVAFLIGYVTPTPHVEEDDERYELAGYEGESPRAFDPYAPQPALDSYPPQPAFDPYAPQPSLDEHVRQQLPGRHRDPAPSPAPDVVQLPDPDRDRQGLLP